jgi:Leucine-rich repeat (LRR) protein
MKTILFILLNAFTFMGYTQTYIPDVNFEQELINLGLDHMPIDGKVRTSSIDTVVNLVLQNSSISNLSGIEGFSALENLKCFCYGVDTLDFSQNQVLKVLDVSNKSAVSSDLVSILLPNSVEVLDISYNTQLMLSDYSFMPNLTSLDIAGNLLIQLNISQNLKLIYLNAWSNDLTSINVSNNIVLEYLNISRNELTSLDLSQNTRLKHLYASFNYLSTLAISNNSILETVYCEVNLLTSLDVSNQPHLKNLSCDRNDLINLDVSNNDSLLALSCSRNSIADIEFGSKNFLKRLYCSSNELTLIDVSEFPSLYIISCEGNQLTSDNLKFNALSSLTELNCTNNLLTELDLSVMSSGWRIIACGQNNLSCLTVKPSSNAEYFQAYGNPNLYCIESSNTDWTDGPYIDININSHSYISESCPTCITSIKELNNVEKKLIGVTDVMGRKIDIHGNYSNQVLLYKYDDGTVEKVFQIGL